MSSRPPAWPPLVTAATVPAWVRVRDLVMTIMAWGVFFWFMGQAIEAVIDYFSYPVFQFTDGRAPDWTELWKRLQPFVAVAGVLVAWLVFWGASRRHYMRQTAVMRQPQPLPLAEHAARWSVDPNDVEAWRALKIAVVEYDAHDNIVDVAPARQTVAAVAGPVEAAKERL